MESFSPEAFFDLSDKRVDGLFKGIQHVWSAVAALPAYIEKIIEPEILGEVEEGAWLEPGLVRLEEGSRVERGAIVRGPTIIGRNTVVRTGAYIRGHVMVGNECMIGHGVEIRQVAVMDNTYLPHKNTIFTSLIGSRVRIGGFTNTANFRLDGQEVIIKIDLEGEKKSFPTGQTLFGAVIGDDVKVGGNVLLLAGCVIGRGSVIYPSCCISGHIPRNTLTRPMRTPHEIVPLDPK